MNTGLITIKSTPLPNIPHARKLVDKMNIDQISFISRPSAMTNINIAEVYGYASHLMESVVIFITKSLSNNSFDAVDCVQLQRYVIDTVIATRVNTIVGERRRWHCVGPMCRQSPLEVVRRPACKSIIFPGCAFLRLMNPVRRVSTH